MLLLSQETMNLWMIAFALVGWGSVVTCILTSFTRMLSSKSRAIRGKCWFMLVLVCGQGIVSHAVMTRAVEGVWEYQYMMLGLSMWLGGRICLTIHDTVRKMYKKRGKK